MEMEIKEIDASFTYPLRHQILRPHQTLNDCMYPLDYEYSSLHLGVYENDLLISVASFFKENHPDLTGDQYRLRGMATLPEHRGRGAGSALIEYAENILQQKKINYWWCNARITAADYYEKHGLKQLGEVFDLQPIGIHKVMFKKMDS